MTGGKNKSQWCNFDLIGRLKNRDDDANFAWDELLFNYSSALLEQAENARKKYNLLIEAEDLVQETFLIAVRGIDHFVVRNNDPTMLLHWLRFILGRSALLLKRQAGEPEWEVEPEWDVDSENLPGESNLRPVEENMIHAESNTEIETEIANILSERASAIFADKHVFEKKLEEIASERKMTPRSVSKSLARSKKKLNSYYKINEEKR